MTNKELYRLLSFSYAKKHAFRPTQSITSRRSVKYASTGRGQQYLIIAGQQPKIKEDCSIERVFKQIK